LWERRSQWTIKIFWIKILYLKKSISFFWNYNLNFGKWKRSNHGNGFYFRKIDSLKRSQMNFWRIHLDTWRLAQCRRKEELTRVRAFMKRERTKVSLEIRFSFSKPYCHEKRAWMNERWLMIAWLINRYDENLFTPTQRRTSLCWNLWEMKKWSLIWAWKELYSVQRR